MRTELRRLILWDVDGTLIRSAGVGRDAFAVAVARAFGRDVADVRDHGVVMGGGTDPQIALAVLTAIGIDEDEARERLPDVLRGLVEALVDAEHDLRTHGFVLPGVRELTERLHRRPDVVQTLLTGNLFENALLKLDAFDLRPFFDVDVGAYGSDHADRNELVPLALDKAEAKYDRGFAPDEVWVVGDTAKDLACARAGGVRCLLVDTGLDRTRTDLRTLGANAVFADLSDVAAVERLLTD